MKKFPIHLLAAAALTLTSMAPVYADDAVMRLKLPNKIFFTGPNGGGDGDPPDGTPNNGPLDITWSSAAVRSLQSIDLPVGIAGGTPPYNVDVSGLPAGITYDPVARKLVGQTTFVGQSNLTFTVTDANNGSDSHNASLTTLNPLFATVSAPEVYAGEAFSFSPSALGLYGTPSWNWSGFDGLGLSLNTSNGQVSGTLPTAGTIPGLRLGFTDSYDSAAANSDPFAITVRPVVDPVATIPAALTAFTGRPFSVTAAATDARAPAAWNVAAGTLPAWATLDPVTGEIRGTPNAIATTSGLALRVLGANGRSDTTDAFSIAVASPFTISLPTNGQTWRQTIPRTLQLTSSAGNPSYQKTGGAEWLAVSPTGVVSGNPPAGTHSLTVRATDDGWTDQTFSITVVPKIAFTTNPGNVTIIAGAAAKTTAVPVLSGSPVNPVYSVVDAAGNPVTLPAWITKAANGQLTVNPGAAIPAQTLYYYLKATDDTGGSIISNVIVVTVTDPPPPQQLDHIRITGSNPYNYDSLYTCMQQLNCTTEPQFNRLNQYGVANTLVIRLKDGISQSPLSIDLRFRAMEVGSFTLRLKDAANGETDYTVTTNGNVNTARNIVVNRSFSEIYMYCNINCQVLLSGLRLNY